MQNLFRTGLKLRNSFSGQIEEFIPRNYNKVRWYICGPTVYSHTHIGHARNYVCSDIMRKIMQYYFHYNFCMNITDIDDKIIRESKKQQIEYFQYAKFWENQFFQDLRSLNIQQPDICTRVTQYLHEIIRFIQQIISNGFAYQVNGSVYFNIQAYKKKFQYNLLKKYDEQDLGDDQNQFNKEKLNQADFALWKKAKENQPFWESPWGNGRPGWHIQCSTMAYQIFGDQIDIHSGGIDLKFPHHQNEISQCHSFHNKSGWVKYFIHNGHLHIMGKKMSKSLKNFITVKEALQIYSGRELRLFFALHRYDSVINFNEESSMSQTKSKDRKIADFFFLSQSEIQKAPREKQQKWEKKEFELEKFCSQRKQKIHEDLCNNLDTPAVLKAVTEIIHQANCYIQLGNPKAMLLSTIIKYLNFILQLLGLNYMQKQKNQQNLTPLLNQLFSYRDKVRQSAYQNDFASIFKHSDNLRDFVLPQFGIKLLDKKIGQSSYWKFQSKEDLLKEKQAKLLMIKKKQQEKQKIQQQRIEKLKIKACNMFLNDQKFSKFDEKGIPTHDNNGKQLSKKQKQKLIALWQKQNKLNQEYQKSIKQS